MNMITHRVSPQQARYTPAGGREKCSFCRFYVAPKWCGHVTGPVSPMGWCKYFSQEMRQRFGGSTVTSGIPAGATLSLDFMSSGNMPVGVTFSRASPATYTDASDVTQTASVNQPRWDYANGVLRGLLIEEARTNLWLQSADASNAAWSKTGLSGAPIVTANQAVAPDGTLVAARVVYPSVSAGGYSNLSQNPTLASSPYAFSVWLRGNVGGERVYLSATADAVAYYRQQCVLTTAWQRFTAVTPAVTTLFWQIGTDMRDAAQTATPAQTVFVWGAQVEAGSSATSYIPTTAAPVTRAADQCYILPANMGFFSPSTGSWFAEFIDLDNTVTNAIVIGQQGGSANSVPMTINTALNLAQWDGASVPTTANSLALGAISKAAVTIGGGTGKNCLNAGAVVSTAMTNGYPALPAAGVGFLNPYTAPNAENMTAGYIRRVQYWPRVLSDAEMQQVTT